ncbi:MULTISPECIES: hypothetical protein [unclassified Moraxella]|uniref:hypothetical protein n=1 Tax=unclassified Moraxella TaxID=2685852 RepID=UPI003AF5308D
MLAMAGGYQLDYPTPNAVSPNQRLIDGGRPILADGVLDKLLANQPLATVPTVLGAVFNLCSHAHRHVSQLAIHTACQTDIKQFNSDVSIDRQSLYWLTLKDHLQTMAMQWRATDDKAQAVKPIDWQSCPLWEQSATSQFSDTAWQNRVRDWFVEQILAIETNKTADVTTDAQPTSQQVLLDWWQHWQMEGETWLYQWVAQQAEKHHPIALYAQQQWQLCQSIAPNDINNESLIVELKATPTCLTQLSEPQLQQLWHAWQTEGNFCQYPHLAGQVPTVGIWGRVAQTLFTNQPENQPTALSLWGQIMARLVDSVALLLHETFVGQDLFYQPNYLPMGALPIVTDDTATRGAVAWVAMGRGILVHLVELVRADGDYRVQRYGVIAPTEWHFHPKGRLYQQLMALQFANVSLTKQQLMAMVTAFDPCVGVSVNGEGL